MKKAFFVPTALAAALTLAGCGGTNSLGGGAPQVTGQTYQQIELLARPAVKEAFETFANHNATNRTSPYNDPTLNAEIATFETTVAGRPTLAPVLQSILIPNEIAADLSQTGSASYLGVETGGATAGFIPGAQNGKFGGRGLPDDVITISLQAIFGAVLTRTPGNLGLVPDDGRESNCLTTQNVAFSQGGPQSQTGFPYLANPR